MANMIFDSCCWCVELKLGCYIIGYLNLISSIAAMVLSGITLRDGLYLTRFHIMEIRETGIVVVVFSVLLLLSLVLLFGFTIALLVGLQKNKPRYLKAFLIYGIIYIVMSGVFVIANIANQTATAVSITEPIIALVLNIYFLLVIRSQYHVMKDPPPTGPVAYNL